MKPQSFNFDVPFVFDPGALTVAPNFTERVKEYFQAHEGQWVNAIDLEQVGGRQAWRTRVSDCRRQFGMTIENRVRKTPSGVKISEYRYDNTKRSTEISTNSYDQTA